jgi:hypothetical protein
MRGLVTVRRAEPDDVPALVKITEEGDPHHPPRTRPESPADRERRFDELVADPRRIVEVACDEDSLIVGLLVATAEDLGTLYPVPALSVSTLMVIPAAGAVASAGRYSSASSRRLSDAGWSAWSLRSRVPTATPTATWPGSGSRRLWCVGWRRRPRCGAPSACTRPSCVRRGGNVGAGCSRSAR